MSNVLTEFLSKYSEAEWLAAVDELLPCVHEVDKDAVQIWFRFFPLELQRYAAKAGDAQDVIQGLALQGSFELKDQIDTSHHFLYGHRFWPKIKCSIEKEAEEFKDASVSLLDVIKEVGMRASEKLKVERKLTNAIAAVGLATLNQVGLDAFKFAEGHAAKPTGIMTKSPDAIVAERAKDDSQGIFGFLKTVNKKYSVTYSNGKVAGKFDIVNEQEISSASSNDRSQDWQKQDERCWEGVVPVECVAASCGTCWVGVLGGADKLTEVSRRERRAMQVFGYNQPEGDRPFLRLACQAKASGNATIVIPPWNGVFGKKVRGNVEDVELEPNTTSAKKLRETLAAAVSAE